jgi:hypothetical protein
LLELSRDGAVVDKGFGRERVPSVGALVSRIGDRWVWVEVMRTRVDGETWANNSPVSVGSGHGTVGS